MHAGDSPGRGLGVGAAWIFGPRILPSMDSFPELLVPILWYEFGRVLRFGLKLLVTIHSKIGKQFQNQWNPPLVDGLWGPQSFLVDEPLRCWQPETPVCMVKFTSYSSTWSRVEEVEDPCQDNNSICWSTWQKTLPWFQRLEVHGDPRLQRKYFILHTLFCLINSGSESHF